MTTQTILSFDVGILNMAYCQIKHTDETRLITGWDTINIMPSVSGGKKKDRSVQTIIDAINKLVLDNKELWSKATEIRIENQPVFKNPTMKTVQIILYSALYFLLDKPIIKFIHAAKKTPGTPKGDAGKAERKAAAIKRTGELLGTCQDPGNIGRVFIIGGKKNGKSTASIKQDLADCFLMSY